MVAIREDIVNQGHGTLTPTLFAVHSTANPGATAKNHRDLWSRGYDYAVHLVVDWTEAYQCVPFNRLCWHVGNGNTTCIGMEICEGTTRDQFNASIENAADVIAQVLRKLGWDSSRLRSHHWFSQNYGGSNHTDPDPYFSRWGYSWAQFINLVNQKMEATMAISDSDANKIAKRVWEYSVHGTLAQDRMLGTDRAANNAYSKISSIYEMLKEVNFVTEFDWLKSRVYRIADWLFNGNNTRLSSNARIGTDLTDQQIDAIAQRVIDKLNADTEA